jgi:nitrite reductase/ring-hydroxylating ferredoxin subunit
MMENWVRVAAMGEFEDEDLIQVKVNDLLIAIYNLGETYYATSDICTHEHACLSDGFVIGGVIECPLHQGCFDIATGKAKWAAVTVDLQTYPTRIDGENIYILM